MTGFSAGKDFQLDPDDPSTIEIEVPVSDDVPGFVRVAVEEDQLGPFNDITPIRNPIGYGPWRIECEGRERLL